MFWTSHRITTTTKKFFEGLPNVPNVFVAEKSEAELADIFLDVGQIEAATNEIGEAAAVTVTEEEQGKFVADNEAVADE